MQSSHVKGMHGITSTLLLHLRQFIQNAAPCHRGPSVSSDRKLLDDVLIGNSAISFSDLPTIWEFK
ncbi:hypothetical protein [Granulicella mallensis]|uniref:hypothetical protein n=1 Tax=Granulicella mallensis TaxID=940614 RepID=UPI0012370AD4|nr:hypothetical protein [Granulicella mallensis]